MPQTAADRIQDKLIERDILFRRADGHIRRLVNKRLAELERDIKALLARIDPHSAVRPAARERRLKRFEEEMRPLVSAAYSDINRIAKGEFRKAAKTESRGTAQLLVKEVP